MVVTHLENHFLGHTLVVVAVTHPCWLSCCSLINCTKSEPLPVELSQNCP
ncbi:hypothetical protein KKH18_14150 [bacterium]|nr:hypothetical protein [bacterium]